MSVTNRIADLGVFQLINTGAGVSRGFGTASHAPSLRIAQASRAGQSWTGVGIRRITWLRACSSSESWCTSARPRPVHVGTGTWDVDGASSTGPFAGARGSGEISVVLATRTATLSGQLKLAGSGGE